jgi:uncharacterized protein (DUF58 family)
MTPLAQLRHWLFRLGRDETLPIVLTQRRIFILPTSAGVLFAAALAVMLTGAINYTLSLGHALVFLLVGLGLAGMVHTFRNLAGLSISPGRANPVHAGEVALFPLHLANTRSEARRALSFRFTDGNTASADVPASATASIHVPCRTSQRGILDPGRITLATHYPLGLFRAWSYPHPPFSCLIYPTPIERPLPPPTAIADAGFTRGDGGHEDFAGLRLRNPGDPPRHIAWKAVARNVDAYPLLVKHFSGGAGEELWLDWELLDGEQDDETRLSILTGWILAAEEACLNYGLAIPGQRIAPAFGAAHRNICLESLALFGYENSPHH